MPKAKRIEIISEVYFKECLPYSTLSKSSLGMAFAVLVQGFPVSLVAGQNNCTRQNVNATVNRFLKAHEKKLEADKRMLKGDRKESALCAAEHKHKS